MFRLRLEHYSSGGTWLDLDLVCRSSQMECPYAKTVDGHTALTLGFREYGLTGDAVARRRIYDMLSISMARAKKSMFRQLSGLMSTGGPSDSKTANQRNLAWHKAQLAESLYQPGVVDEGETLLELVEGAGHPGDFDQDAGEMR